MKLCRGWCNTLQIPYAVGPDGKTACEKWKGKKFRKEAYEIGALVYYQPLKDKQGKMEREELTKDEAQWSIGVWLGYRSQAEDSIIGTMEGTRYSSCIKEMQGPETWSAEHMDPLVGTPWDNHNPREGGGSPAGPGSAGRDLLRVGGYPGVLHGKEWGAAEGIRRLGSNL